MSTYQVIDPRVLNLKLRKTIQILEKHVTEIDPALLEIDQLRTHIEYMKNEIEKVQIQWLNGIQKHHLEQIELKNKSEAEFLFNVLEKIENDSKNTKEKK